MISIPPIVNTPVTKTSQNSGSLPAPAASARSNKDGKHQRNNHQSESPESQQEETETVVDVVVKESVDKAFIEKESTAEESLEEERRHKRDRRHQNLKPLYDMRSGIDRRKAAKEKSISICA